MSVRLDIVSALTGTSLVTSTELTPSTESAGSSPSTPRVTLDGGPKPSVPVAQKVDHNAWLAGVVDHNAGRPRSW